MNRRSFISNILVSVVALVAAPFVKTEEQTKHRNTKIDGWKELGKTGDGWKVYVKPLPSVSGCYSTSPLDDDSLVTYSGISIDGLDDKRLIAYIDISNNAREGKLKWTDNKEEAWKDGHLVIAEGITAKYNINCSHLQIHMANSDFIIVNDQHWKRYNSYSQYKTKD